MSIWPPNPPESTAYAFNREERARLTVYRAAVAAGFYTDQLHEAEGSRPTATLVR